MKYAFSAVIFDLDGLVLDTETTYFAAWKLAAAEMGFDLTDEFCFSLSGLHYSMVQQRLCDVCGKSFDVDRFNRISSRCWHDYVALHGIKIKKGFHSLLALIKSLDIPYSLATNSLQINAEYCLALAGLERAFSSVVTRDRVSEGKPAPDLFFSAAKEMQVAISRCLVLEDSTTGIIAASRAGAYSAYIPSISPSDLVAMRLSDYQFESLAGVAELIRVNFA